MLPVLVGLIVRHVLTFAGGAAVATSATAANVQAVAPDQQAIIGAVATLAGLVWSYVEKRRAAAQNA